MLSSREYNGMVALSAVYTVKGGPGMAVRALNFSCTLKEAGLCYLC